MPLEEDPHFQSLRWLARQHPAVKRSIVRDCQDLVLRDNETFVNDIAFDTTDLPIRPIVVLHLFYCYDASDKQLETFHEDLRDLGYGVKIERLRTVLREGKAYAELAKKLPVEWSPFDLPADRSPTSFTKLSKTEIPRLVGLLRLTCRGSPAKRTMAATVGKAVGKHMECVKGNPVEQAVQRKRRERAGSNSSASPTKRQRRGCPRFPPEIVHSREGFAPPSITSGPVSAAPPGDRQKPDIPTIPSTQRIQEQTDQFCDLYGLTEPSQRAHPDIPTQALWFSSDPFEMHHLAEQSGSHQPDQLVFY
ncbi:hypothetical protein VDGE_30069 [Verticillium dahliae]|uniref:Uncharacterized protein n=1 Tax=Verticillium dahliae TaxID=27337 RepID=A0A444RRH9_VERDA|nr:hypothetical protein VDGE_30069 [Verticillium dahliae]